jgi:O-antigen/teichoic acid export membrane protein
MAGVFTPMSSASHATRDEEQLRRILILGNRYSSLVILPLACVLLVLGKSVIGLWAGRTYESAFMVLAILVPPTALYLMQAASTKVLYGIGRHYTLALVLLVEGILNLVLSIVLGKRFGIDGVALGTAIPLALTSVCFLPAYLSRVLSLPISKFLRETYAEPIVLAIPFAVILALLKWIVVPDTYPKLILTMTVAGFWYAGSLLYVRRRLERRTCAYSAA